MKETYTAQETEALIANSTNFLLERFAQLIEAVEELDAEIEVIKRGEHIFYDVLAIEDDCDELNTQEVLLASTYPGLTAIRLAKQRQYCEVTVDGLPALNAPAEQGGDYILGTSAAGHLVINFHDVIPAGVTVTIRAYRA